MSYNHSKGGKRMDWKPQFSTETPIFRQIFHYYENQIINGLLVPGSKFPAERVLASLLSVNRSTVSAAFEELRAAGHMLEKDLLSFIWILPLQRRS
jgi:DNA-binding transcriptional regulator YhcF (GntR family)